MRSVMIDGDITQPELDLIKRVGAALYRIATEENRRIEQQKYQAPVGKRGAPRPNVQQQIMMLHKKGYSVRQTAKVLALSPSTVYRIVKQRTGK